MSLIELHPQLTGIEEELRGVRLELSRIGDILERLIPIGEPYVYDRPKKGAESVVSINLEKMAEIEKEKQWKQNQGFPKT
jgi:hypothetical protein